MMIKLFFLTQKIFDKTSVSLEEKYQLKYLQKIL